MSRIGGMAKEYAAKGWPVFPVKMGGKEPLVNDFPNTATTDLATIDKWWATWPEANIGFVPGLVDMMVLDLDEGYTDDDLIGYAEDTQLRACTPNKGQHWFYKLQPGEVVRPSASKLAPNIDVRSHNSYVLLAPSKLENNHRGYEWVLTGTPAMRSDAMYRAVTSSREKSEDSDEWTITPDLAHNVEAAAEWLRSTAKVALEGQGGDAMAFATAARMKSMGLSQGKALEVMDEHWNSRCEPPWDYEGLERKVANGYKYNSDPPGNYTEEYIAQDKINLFGPLLPREEDEEVYEQGIYRFATMAGICKLEPPSWLIKDFLPEEGYCLMYGGEGTFKTFLALDIALSLAHEGHAGYWGRAVGDAAAPVLYAAGEGRRAIGKRVAAWQTYNTGDTGGTQAPFMLVDPVPATQSFRSVKNVNSQEFENFIRGARRAYEAYSLTIIDTIGRSMQGTNENEQENASKFTALVQAIQRELGGVVLALHHTGHSTQERSRGSSVFGTDPDTIVGVQRSEKDYLVSMKMDKQKDDEEWAKPKLAMLHKVELELGNTSLCPRAATSAEGLRDPSDPGPWFAQLIIDKVTDYPGRVFTMKEMVEYLQATTECAECNVLLKRLVHDRSWPAYKHFKAGGWTT